MIFPEPTSAMEVPVGYHGAVCDFKRRLIERALLEASGNRTHAARVLGLQRTYLLRLIRELQVSVPPPADRRRRALEDRMPPPAMTSSAMAPQAMTPPA